MEDLNCEKIKYHFVSVPLGDTGSELFGIPTTCSGNFPSATFDFVSWLDERIHRQVNNIMSSVKKEITSIIETVLQNNNLKCDANVVPHNSPGDRITKSNVSGENSILRGKNRKNSDGPNEGKRIFMKNSFNNLSHPKYDSDKDREGKKNSSQASESLGNKQPSEDEKISEKINYLEEKIVTYQREMNTLQKMRHKKSSQTPAVTSSLRSANKSINLSVKRNNRVTKNKDVINNKDQNRYRTLTSEEKERIISGRSCFKTKQANLIFFKGLKKNRPHNIRSLLYSEGLNPRSIPHIGFDKKGRL